MQNKRTPRRARLGKMPCVACLPTRLCRQQPRPRNACKGRPGHAPTLWGSTAGPAEWSSLLGSFAVDVPARPPLCWDAAALAGWTAAALAVEHYQMGALGPHVFFPPVSTGQAWRQTIAARTPKKWKLGLEQISCRLQNAVKIRANKNYCYCRADYSADGGCCCSLAAAGW